MDVDILDPVPAGDIGQPFAIGREDRSLFIESIVSERNGLLTNRHQVKLIERDKSDLFTIRGECRRIDAFDGMLRGLIEVITLMSVLRANAWDRRGKPNGSLRGRSKINVKDLPVCGVNQLRVRKPYCGKWKRVPLLSR